MTTELTNLTEFTKSKSNGTTFTRTDFPFYFTEEQVKQTAYTILQCNRQWLSDIIELHEMIKNPVNEDQFADLLLKYIIPDKRHVLKYAILTHKNIQNIIEVLIYAATMHIQGVETFTD